MPKSNPRINIVCEEPLYHEISELAKSEGASLSSIAHDLIREALELREDRALATIAEERATTFDPQTALTFDQVFED